MASLELVTPRRPFRTGPCRVRRDRPGQTYRLARCCVATTVADHRGGDRSGHGYSQGPPTAAVAPADRANPAVAIGPVSQPVDPPHKSHAHLDLTALHNRRASSASYATSPSLRSAAKAMKPSSTICRVTVLIQRSRPRASCISKTAPAGKVSAWRDSRTRIRLRGALS